jgi:formylglycine-generating enzyme required for sulfatase activity
MRLLLKRTKCKARFFREQLSDTVSLDMMLIPSGTFLMGSPEDEINRSPNESPQHSVTVPSFCMGKYPITQAQWHVVANRPQVERELNPNSSNFSGEDHPVEQVSWFDAQEFCSRLSKLTKREYRLPSEAEWEYAARAGTTSTFHFGETITTDLANYNWKKSYGRGSIRSYGTNTIGTFPPNVFGLYDMHGNVFEWCLDHYHNSYQGAPNDGIAWIDPNVANDAHRILRGGSWCYKPHLCRSAFRNNYTPDSRFNYIGFRVLCSAARTD